MNKLLEKFQVKQHPTCQIALLEKAITNCHFLLWIRLLLMLLRMPHYLLQRRWWKRSPTSGLREQSAEVHRRNMFLRFDVGTYRWQANIIVGYTILRPQVTTLWKLAQHLVFELVNFRVLISPNFQLIYQVDFIGLNKNLFCSLLPTYGFALDNCFCRKQVLFFWLFLLLVHKFWIHRCYLKASFFNWYYF